MDEKNIKSEIISMPKYFKYSIYDYSDDELYEEEDIIFFHHFYKVSKFEIKEDEDLIQLFNNLSKNEFANNTIIDDNEIENVKIDQSLTNLNSKIIKFLTYKDTDFNCTFMENFYSYANEIGFDYTVGYLFPLIKDLSFKDSVEPNIILSFFKNFDKLLDFLLKEENKNKGYQIIMTYIIPLIHDIFETKSNEIKLLNEAANSLKLIIKISNNDDKIQLIRLLLDLSQNNSNINVQILIIQIFNSISESIGQLLTESFIVPQIIAFSEDITYEIRLSCINNIINICNVISYECFIDKIYPCYLNLIKDNNWEIRKKCIDILPSLCKISTSDLISNKFLILFINGINDKDINVKNSCLEILGEFLNYIPKTEFKKIQLLINFYVNENLEIDNSFEDNLILIQKNAFNFPSVLLAFIKQMSIEIWEQIKIVYFSFFHFNDLKLQLTISSSFPEISKIIGIDKSEIDIAPQILLFYDNSDLEIKNNIIFHLPEYLSSINDKKIKSQFLYCFAFRNRKWRDQIKFVKVLGKLIDIYDIDILDKNIFSTILELCFDSFNKVRKKSIKELSKYLYKYCNINEDYKTKALIILESFGNCIHYHYRQLFIYLIWKFLSNENLFMEIIYELFYNLSFDKIDIVRITQAKFLNKYLKKENNEYKWIINNKNIQEIIYRFKNDKAKEVKDYMKDFEINQDFSNSQIDNNKKKLINKKFINRMGILYDLYKIESIYFGEKWFKK